MEECHVMQIKKFIRRDERSPPRGYTIVKEKKYIIRYIRKSSQEEIRLEKNLFPGLFDIRDKKVGEKGKRLF